MRCYQRIKNRARFIGLRGPKLKLPYPANKTLWIAHNVIAEAQTFLSYGIKLPKYWWDTLIEDRKLKFGKVQSHSLLAACGRYGIQTISEDLKKYFINKIILANETYTDEQLSNDLNIVNLMLRPAIIFKTD